MSADQAGVEFEGRVDSALQTPCELARALTGARQPAMGMMVGDWLHARKYFSLWTNTPPCRDFAMPTGEMNVVNPDKPKKVRMVAPTSRNPSFRHWERR